MNNSIKLIPLFFLFPFFEQMEKTIVVAKNEYATFRICHKDHVEDTLAEEKSLFVENDPPPFYKDPIFCVAMVACMATMCLCRIVDYLILP